MKLYYSPGSCALASHIALAEAGADYEPVRLDFAAAEQRTPAYLALNPKGRVPALVTERGALTETPAILAFIAQSYPAARLAPLDDPFAFAEMQAFNSYLCATVHVAHAHRARGSRWADLPESLEDMRRKVPQTMAECFALIEERFFRGPWVMGDAYTVCDPYLLTVSRWLEGDGVDRARFPNVDAHAARMLERPRVASALAEHFGPGAS
jgi:glutathione S-transferase